MIHIRLDFFGYFQAFLLSWNIIWVYFLIRSTDPEAPYGQHSLLDLCSASCSFDMIPQGIQDFFKNGFAMERVNIHPALMLHESSQPLRHYQKGLSSNSLVSIFLRLLFRPPPHTNLTYLLAHYFRDTISSELWGSNRSPCLHFLCTMRDGLVRILDSEQTSFPSNDPYLH